jgi:hypothetical protein
MQLSGSFGNELMPATGGTLHVELSLSPKAARYEQIELRTPFINRKFSEVFRPFRSWFWKTSDPRRVGRVFLRCSVDFSPFP